MQNHVDTIEVDATWAGKVVTQGRQLLLIDCHDGVDGTFSDMQGGGVR
jgi:hypothetical protein